MKIRKFSPIWWAKEIACIGIFCGILGALMYGFFYFTLGPNVGMAF